MVETNDLEFKINKVDSYKKNFSIMEDIHLGDLVELNVDGKSFQRDDGKYEKYAGYVALLKEGIIGLSPTHHGNRKHGYTSKEHSPYSMSQEIVKIEANCIKEYRRVGR